MTAVLIAAGQGGNSGGIPIPLWLGIPLLVIITAVAIWEAVRINKRKKAGNE